MVHKHYDNQSCWISKSENMNKNIYSNRTDTPAYTLDWMFTKHEEIDFVPNVFRSLLVCKGDQPDLQPLLLQGT